MQELARFHGGDVTVTSQEGRGTTFTVTVRTGTSHCRTEQSEAARRASTSVGAIPCRGASLAAGGRRIDRPPPGPAVDVFAAPSLHARPRRLCWSSTTARTCATIWNRILGQHYRVEVVGDGRAALDRIRHRAPDLVIADVMMPTLDGFGLLTAIRADERSRSIPVILLSARAGEEARIEGLDAGADEYLVKPFSARELLASVASQLKLARLHRETERVLRYRSEQYQTLESGAARVSSWTRTSAFAT